MNQPDLFSQLQGCSLVNLEILLREITPDPLYIELAQDRCFEMAQDMVGRDQRTYGFSDIEKEIREPFVLAKVLHREYVDMYIDYMEFLYKDEFTLWYDDLEGVLRSKEKEEPKYEVVKDDITYVFDRPKEATGKMLSMNELWGEIKDRIDEGSASFISDIIKRKTNALARRLDLSSSDEYFELRRDVRAEILGRLIVGLDNGRYDHGMHMDFVPTDEWFYDEFEQKYKQFDDDSRGWS